METATASLPNLLEPIRNGNRAAFESLFHEWYAPLVRFGREFLKDTDAAEDLVQEVFVKLWERRQQLSVQTSLKAYLYMAVKNQCLNKLKAEQRNHWIDETQEDLTFVAYEQTDHKAASGLLARHISEALDTLPPKCALIFKLSRFEEKSYKEIAEILDLSVKTVENQMGKALLLMRRQLAPYLQLILLLLITRGN